MLDLAPWGHPPTPLLPKWYRDELGHVTLPVSIVSCRMGSSPTTVGELCDLWEDDHTAEESAVLASAAPLEFLKEIVRDYGWPPEDTVVFPDGTTRSQINRYPLSPRTLNALRRNGLLQGSRGITVDELIWADGIGLVSLVELMCVTESAVPELTSTLEPVTGLSPHRTSTDLQRPTSTVWLGPIGRLLAAAQEFYGADSVLDALALNLSGIAEAAGVASDLEELRIDALTRGNGITKTIVTNLSDLYASLSSRDRLIVDERLSTSHPQTLQHLGNALGVSRARISQIQQRIRRNIEERVGPDMTFVVGILRDRIGPVVPEGVFADILESVFHDDSMAEEVSVLAVHMAKSQLNYSLANGVLVDEDGKLVARSLRDSAKELCDDVGLIEEDTLCARLPGREWEPYFDGLLDWCGFHRFGPQLALRDTVGARIKSALLEIGHPATLDDICARVGHSTNSVRSRLSSMSTVARASKTMWGLREWIDDEYEGIPAEVIQRINEDGGSTPLQRLVEELPRLFGVAEGSVRACVATPQFVLRDGQVSLADASSVALRTLSDVIDGYDDTGRPYWLFSVKSRYFDGHSVPYLPPEIARALGCQPNGNAAVIVEQPLGCPPLSVRWRLTSASGASLGYLARPLEILGAAAGDRVRLTIVGSGQVLLAKEDESPGRDRPRPPSPTDLLERLKSRRAFL